MKVTLKRLAIALAGVATVIVVLAHRGESTKTFRVAAPEGTAYGSYEATRKEIPDGLPQRPDLGRRHANLFAPDSSAPVIAPPTAKAEAPAAPVPPPNPYRFAGSLLHDGKFRTFITDGDRLYEVSNGDELSAQYRVEAVTRDEVVLVFIPLGSRHPIPAKWAFSLETLTVASMTVVQGGSAPALPPGSPLMAAAGEPALASPLPPGSPLAPTKPIN